MTEKAHGLELVLFWVAAIIIPTVICYGAVALLVWIFLTVNAALHPEISNHQLPTI
ncbi:hypothetical protein [Glaciihabitans sp. UYNi722]|uniref:hypothetical protein n=1 Tax=Glaciihabitans sp. UYNi722 TaxID=3156344 RepID=UPI003395F349